MRTFALVMSFCVCLATTAGADERHDPRRVQELIEYLASDDPGVCGAAINGLARLGPEAKAALPALINRLGNAPVIRNHLQGNIGADPEDAIRAMGSEALDWLSAALHHKSPDVRKRVVDMLGDLGPKARHLVPNIREATRDADQDVRLEAMNALLRLDRDAGYPLLLKWLTSKSAREREQAVSALGWYADRSEKALPHLLKALRDVDPCMRASAARSLGSLAKSPASVVPALAELLNDRSQYAVSISNHAQGLGSVAEAAANALASFGEKASPAAPRLLAILADDSIDGATSDSVADSLATLGPAGRPFVPKLVELLQRPGVDPQFQRSVLKALRGLGPNAKWAVPAVKRLFEQADKPEDSEDDVAFDAACTLVSIEPGDCPAAWQALLDYLDGIARNDPEIGDDSYRRGDLILNTLRQIGSAAKPALPGLLATIEGDYFGGGEIVPILCEIGREAGAGVPLMVTHCPDVFYRQEAALALHKISPELIPALIAGLDESTEDRNRFFPILEGLGHLRERAAAAIPAVVRLSQDERNEALRQAAAETLGRIHSEPEVVIPELIRLLKDQRPRIRAEAAQSLGAFRAAAAPAAETLTAALQDEYIDVRAAAAEALGQIGSAARAKMPALEKTLSDRSPYVRGTAKQALAALR